MTRRVLYPGHPIVEHPQRNGVLYVCSDAEIECLMPERRPELGGRARAVIDDVWTVSLTRGMPHNR